MVYERRFGSRSLTDCRSSTPLQSHRSFSPVSRMLSSQSAAALSGSGSAAGKSAGHGAVVMGAGVRAGFARGLGPMGLGIPGRFELDKEGPPHMYSGSEVDSDSGDEDELMRSVGDNRRGGGVKRERAEMEAAIVRPEAGLPSMALAAGAAGAKPGKKTRGRVKIKMEFIDNKLRRYTTFSKRKTGIMKKVRNYHADHSN